MSLKITYTALIVIGLMLLAYTVLRFVSTDSILDMSPLHPQADGKQPDEWPLLVGTIFVASGIMGMILIQRRRR
jgi:hypothetical protein